MWTSENRRVSVDPSVSLVHWYTGWNQSVLSPVLLGLSRRQRRDDLDKVNTIRVKEGEERRGGERRGRARSQILRCELLFMDQVFRSTLLSFPFFSSIRWDGVRLGVWAFALGWKSGLLRGPSLREPLGTYQVLKAFILPEYRLTT